MLAARCRIGVMGLRVCRSSLLRPPPAQLLKCLPPVQARRQISELAGMVCDALLKKLPWRFQGCAPELLGRGEGAAQLCGQPRQQHAPQPRVLFSQLLINKMQTQKSEASLNHISVWP